MPRLSLATMYAPPLVSYARTVCVYEMTTIASSSAIAIETGRTSAPQSPTRRRARRAPPPSRTRPTTAGRTRRPVARGTSRGACPPSGRSPSAGRRGLASPLRPAPTRRYSARSRPPPHFQRFLRARRRTLAERCVLRSSAWVQLRSSAWRLRARAGRAGAQPRCALPLRGATGRRALGTALRGAGLDRQHARLQLVLPAADAHVPASRLGELGRARGLPRDGGERQRARRRASAGSRGRTRRRPPCCARSATTCARRSPRS